MPTYRVKYQIWRIDSPDAATAKKELVDMLKTMPDKLFTVELALEKRPLWKQFLLG